MRERLGKIASISPLKISILVIFLALALFYLDAPFLRFMELKALDLRMVSRGKIAPGTETVIVAVDEKSLDELGRWPWPRSTIAKLIDKLKAKGVKAVGFDIVFAEPDSNSSLRTIKELSREVKQLGLGDRKLASLLERKRSLADNDAILARSIKRAGNVSLGYFFHFSPGVVAHITDEEVLASADRIANSRYQMIQSKAQPDASVFMNAYTAVSSLQPMTNAASNSGYFNAFPDSDGVIRWSPMVIKFQDNYYYSLALSLLVDYLDSPNLTLNLAEFGVQGIRIGPIDIPTDENGRLLINYLGPAKTFPHYSVSDILFDRLPPELFKDKIALVGATAVGIYDLRVTPFSPVYPGVEIHATVIDNILRQQFLQHSGATRFMDFCMIILSGLIVGWAIPRLRAVQGLLLILGLLVTFTVVNTYIFGHYNVWLNLIYPVLTMIVAYLAITIYRYMTEEKEKKKVRGAFQYYLNASVINEMLKDPAKLKLGGDKKDLTVLFSDIRGFTTVSEKLSPEDLVHLLNEYLTAMTDIVFRYDGLLDKYMGDAIMAVYGAPLDQPDHAVRACRTALEMMSELKRLQVKWTAEGRPALNIGVGVNTGDMVVGNMGSQMRFDYTVMGDAVNLGSRLEGINKEYGTNIIISENTHRVVKDLLFCRELDAVRVKGKKLPIQIYELLGERRDAAKWEPFVGPFEEGLARYREGKWDEAIALFQKVLAVRPDDEASVMYIDRCNELKAHPPEGPWDGVFTMTRK